MHNLLRRNLQEEDQIQRTFTSKCEGPLWARAAAPCRAAPKKWPAGQKERGLKGSNGRGERPEGLVTLVGRSTGRARWGGASATRRESSHAVRGRWRRGGSGRARCRGVGAEEVVVARTGDGVGDEDEEVARVGEGRR
jgi:hypothetical protein